MSKIGQWCLRSTLMSKIGHSYPKSDTSHQDHRYPSNLDILKFRVQIFFEPLKNRIFFLSFQLQETFLEDQQALRSLMELAKVKDKTEILYMSKH